MSPVTLSVHGCDRLSPLATSLAVVTRLESGQWSAHLPDVPGVWAAGPTQEIALDTLCEVYRAWARLDLGAPDARP